MYRKVMVKIKSRYFYKRRIYPLTWRVFILIVRKYLITMALLLILTKFAHLWISGLLSFHLKVEMMTWFLILNIWKVLMIFLENLSEEVLEIIRGKERKGKVCIKISMWPAWNKTIFVQGLQWSINWNLLLLLKYLLIRHVMYDHIYL